MKIFTWIAAVCAASMILAGVASAADLPNPASSGYAASPSYSVGASRDAAGGYGHRRRHGGSLLGFGHRGSAYGRHRSAYGHQRSAFGHQRSAFGHRGSMFGHRSSAAGRAKQRHRTHLDRCQTVPSRC